MKNSVRRFVSIMIAMCLCLSTLVGVATADSATLSAPTLLSTNIEVKIGDEPKIAWNPVNGADAYRIIMGYSSYASGRTPQDIAGYDGFEAYDGIEFDYYDTYTYFWLDCKVPGTAYIDVYAYSIDSDGDYVYSAPSRMTVRIKGSCSHKYTETSHFPIARISVKSEEGQRYIDKWTGGSIDYTYEYVDERQHRYQDKYFEVCLVCDTPYRTVDYYEEYVYVEHEFIDGACVCGYSISVPTATPGVIIPTPEVITPMPETTTPVPEIITPEPEVTTQAPEVTVMPTLAPEIAAPKIEKVELSPKEGYVGDTFEIKVTVNSDVKNLIAVNDSGVGMRSNEPEDWRKSENEDGTWTWRRYYTAGSAKKDRYWIVTPVDGAESSYTPVKSNEVNIAEKVEMTNEWYDIYYKLDNKGTKQLAEDSIIIVDNTQVKNIQIYAGDIHPSNNNAYYYKVGSSDVLYIDTTHSFDMKVGTPGTTTVEIWNKNTNQQVATVKVIVFTVSPDFWDEVRIKFIDAGFDADWINDDVSKFIDYIQNAPAVYRNIFIYSFGKYGYDVGDGLRSEGNAEFDQYKNTIKFDDSIETSLDDWLWDKDFYTTFFHETGHAVDWYANELIGDERFTTQLFDDGYLYFVLEEEVKTVITRYVNSVASDMNRDDRKQIITAFMGNEKGEWIYDRENEVYEIVEHPTLTNKQKAVFDEVYAKLTEDTKKINRNSYMLKDMLMAYTIWEDEDTTHSGDSYWYYETTPNYYSSMEAWAEYYSAQMTGDTEAMESNLQNFPKSCEYMDKVLAKEIEKYYRNQMAQ